MISSRILTRGLLLCLLLFVEQSSAAIQLSDDDRPLIELGALILGGIGIFLIGIHFAAEHLQQMAGGQFEHWVGKLSSRITGTALLGGALGFVTQSGKAVAFILSDLVKAQLIDGRQAALVIFWGNVGSSLIILTSMASLKVLALLVLGVTALGLTFHIPKRLVHVYGALFGLAMIMFGLYLVKDGSAGIASAGWVPDFIEALRHTYILSFAAGLILTLLIQSNLAASMLSIALATSGLLTLQEAVAVIIGAQAGTGFLTFIFSFHASGRARQVVAYQIAFDLVATLFWGSLFILEIAFGVPLVMRLIESLFFEVGTQAVILAILLQFTSALLAVALRNRIYLRVDELCPPKTSESLSEPEFLSRGSGSTAELNLLMIEKEQLRLMRRLPRYLEYARGEESLDQAVRPAEYHEAFQHLAKQINALLAHISRGNLNNAMAEALITAAKSQELLRGLERYIFQIAEMVRDYSEEDKARDLGLNILESVDFLVFSAIYAVEGKDPEEIAMLASMTNDRTQMMIRMRNAYFEAEEGLSHSARSYVLDMTMLLENIVKTLSRYGEVLNRKYKTVERKESESASERAAV